MLYGYTVIISHNNLLAFLTKKMQHNIVRKHRRTVSSINVGENLESEHKNTMSTFEDTQQIMHTEIPNLDAIGEKSKHKLRHRAISDLIEACNKAPDSKSVMVEELNVSINYKDPTFQFGKDKRLQELQERKHLFKKSNAKLLDSIVEKSVIPKSSRMFLRKKIIGLQSQKNSLFSKKPGTNTVVNSLSKPTQNSVLTTSVKPGIKLGQKIQKKEPVSVKKQAKKTQVKKNFKF